MTDIVDLDLQHKQTHYYSSSFMVYTGCQPISIFLLNSYILGPNPIFLSTSYIPIISPIFLKYFLYFQENLLSMNDHIYTK